MDIDLKKLRFTHGLNQKEMADILGVSKQQISNIEGGKSNLTPKNYHILEQKFGINNVKSENQIETNEVKNRIVNVTARYEIPYWEGLTEDLKLTNMLSSKWEDVETIVNLWGRKPQDLRVIAMYGNAMEGYWYRLNNRDLLLMDISSTDLTKSGVYLFTTDNGNNIFIRELTKRYDGSVIAKRYEPNGQVFERVITKEEMEDLNFTVVGRIFKNINFTL